MHKVKHNTYTYVSGVQIGRVIHAVDVTHHVFYYRTYVSQAWHAVTVLSQGIKARITKYEMVLGTGQMLQLDASPSQDLDRSPGTLQVMHMSKLQN